MNIREQFEKRETNFMSPFGCQSAQSRGRRNPEEPCPIRTAFQVDRDRIVYSNAFRRLKHKTQVFLNPLDNVCKYSRPGDRVEVTLRRGREGIACAVYDTGPGIPAEHLPHITRRFYRADRRGMEGSGLGLALVKEILRRHQSRLEIESRAGGEETGTCARFILPVSEGEVE